MENGLKSLAVKIAELVIDECIKICNENLKLEPVETLTEFQDGAKSAIKIIIMDLEQLKARLSKAVG